MTLHEMRNIQETRKAACNTGNTDLHRSPISCYVMPGCIMPVIMEVHKATEQKVKKLIGQFNKEEMDKLLKLLEDL